MTSNDRRFVEHSLRTIASACLFVADVEPAGTIASLVTKRVILDELLRRGLIPTSTAAWARDSALKGEVFSVLDTFALIRPRMVQITDDMSHWPSGLL